VFGAEAPEGVAYTNGNVVVDSNAVIHGSVYARGTVRVDSNAEVKEDINAGGAVGLLSNSIARRHVTSATSSIALSGTSVVYGDARAGTTITTIGQSIIHGTRSPNSPSDPPPAPPFPTYAFDAADWPAGYQVNTFSSCGSAKSFINGIAGGDHVVRITAPYTLSWTGNESVTVRANLAIISDGGLFMDSNAQFRNSGDPHGLSLMFGIGSPLGCSQNIAFNANTRIGPDLTTLMYTPCAISMDSNSFVTSGQMFGGVVDLDSNTSLRCRLSIVPGFGPSG
jgi:cytoskeletal protein CcmA (bactofilin family)